MLTRVSRTMLSGGHDDPIVVVAWGGENMVGSTNSNNGPLYLIDNVQIWDRGAAALRPVDASANTYAVYCGSPGNVPFTTMGGGRNSPAFGFAYRLAKETGRKVIIVPNCTIGRNIDYWILNGTSSVDWEALQQDLAAVFAATGLNSVDFLIGQQGEANADDGDAVGVYAAELVTFINQVKAASWWKVGVSQMVFGEPCRAWSSTAFRDYLLAELATVAAMKLPGVSFATSLAGVGGAENVLPPGDVATGSSLFSGRSLYSLGYYNYWFALPDYVTGKKSYASQWNELPWGPDGETKYPTSGVTFTRQAHLASAPQYTLAPTVAKIGSRLFVGATTNINAASESGGSAGRVVWSDDDGTTWIGDTATGNGIGFERSGGAVAEPTVWTAPDGKLWVFMMSWSNLTNTNDGRHGIHLSVIENPLFSGTDIPAIPHPECVVPFGWCQKPEYLNGKWYLPVSYWQSLNNGNEGVVNFVPYLQGRHYFEIDWVNRKLSWAFHMADIDPGHQFDEASMTPLADGSFLGSWRTLEGPRRSYSSDKGKSWTAPVAYTGMGTQAASTAAISRHRTITGPAGIILFAWNNAAGRTNLTVAMNTGTSGIGVVNPAASRTKVVVAGSASYPDLLIDGDNCYLVCDDGFGPTNSRSATRRIRMFKFSLNALRTNAAGMTITEKTTPIKGT